MFIFYLAFVSFAPYSLGFLSSFLGEFNLFLFGEFSKYYPFLLLFFNYIFYKRAYDLDNVKKRELNGFIVAFASLMILFAILSLNAGYIPEVLYTIVGALFGRLGSGLLALAFLIFACVLLFPRFFELVFGVKISFSAFEKLDLAFSSFLEKVFGGKEKNEKQEEILEEDKKESVKEHENNIDESLNLKHIQEVKQELEELSKEESLNETENIEEKTEPAELEKDEILLSYNQELRDFVLKASAEPDELEQSISTHKQEVYVPQKFLKPKKIDEIKLNLAKRLNYEEPSYTRKKSEFKDETVKESKEEQKEPAKQEPSIWNSNVIPYYICRTRKSRQIALKKPASRSGTTSFNYPRLSDIKCCVIPLIDGSSDVCHSCTVSNLTDPRCRCTKCLDTFPIGPLSCSTYHRSSFN